MNNDVLTITLPNGAGDIIERSYTYDDAVETLKTPLSNEHRDKLVEGATEMWPDKADELRALKPDMEDPPASVFAFPSP